MDPQQPNPTGAPSPEPRSKSLALSGTALVALVVVLAGLGLYWYFVLRTSDAQTPRSADISELSRRGLYKEAVAEYHSALESGLMSQSQRALAAVNVFEALFKANGKIEDVLWGVQELKTAFAVPGVNNFAQSQIIMALATAYYDSGEHPVVLDEVYKDEPFKSKYNASRSRTQRDMMRWAFDLYPNSRAAIAIANTYVSYVLGIPYVEGREGGDEVIADMIAKAKDYLQRSEDLLQKELASNSLSKETSRYAAQRYWRVFVMASTVYTGDTEFRGTYQKEYQSFIDEFAIEGHSEARQYVPFAFWNSAIGYSKIEGNESAAKAQILRLIEYVNADPRKDVSEFVTLMRNEKERFVRDGPNYNSTWLAHFTVRIPEFKAFIDEIQASHR